MSSSGARVVERSVRKAIPRKINTRCVGVSYLSTGMSGMPSNHELHSTLQPCGVVRQFGVATILCDVCGSEREVPEVRPWAGWARHPAPGPRKPHEAAPGRAGSTL